MMNIFQDESGCLGFQPGSSSYFVVTLLCPQNSKHISNVIRKFKGDVIAAGWPRQLEIKASSLFHAKYNPVVPQNYAFKNNPEKPIFDVLKRLNSCSIEIDTIVVNKAKINANLRTLPFGILWNYFSAQVLVDRITKYDDVILICDEHNKESHSQLHFDGYILTSAKMTKGRNFPCQIIHANSNVVRGISAVDFICWAIFRNYEFNDVRFFKLVQAKIQFLKRFFF